MNGIVDFDPYRVLRITDLMRIRTLCGPAAVRMTLDQFLGLDASYLVQPIPARILGMEVLIRAPDPFPRWLDQEIGL